MANRLIKVQTPTGWELLELTPAGSVVDSGGDTPSADTFFVQQDQPTVSNAYAWIQLNPDGTPHTMWVEDGGP